MDIPLCHLTTTITIPSDNQYTLILQCTREFRKWGMTLDNNRRIQWNLKLFAKFCDSFCFVFSTAICQKDKRDVLFFEISQRVCGAGDGL